MLIDDTFYFHIKTKERLILSNLPKELYSEADNCPIGKETIVCPLIGERKRQGKIEMENGYVYACCFDRNITAKIFQYKLDTLVLVYRAFVQSALQVKGELKGTVDRYQHNINTFIAKIQDEIEYMLPLYEMKFHDWKSSQHIVKDCIEKDPEKAALGLLRIYKYISLAIAENNVFDLFYVENTNIDIEAHPIYKLLELSFKPFFLDFLNKKIYLNMESTYVKVYVDFSSISVVFAHLWDNALKYVLDNSDIGIRFIETDKYLSINISMRSMKIEDEEKEKICSKGYSGKYAVLSGCQGHGIGMFYIKKLVELNKGEFTFDSRGSFFLVNGIPYVNNIFKITLPIAKNNP